MSRKLLGLSVVAVLAIVASVGCAAAPSVGNLGAKQSAPAAAPQAANANRAAKAPESAAAPAEGTAADAREAQAFSQAQAQTLDRMVIRTAQMSLEVTDMEQALSQVRQIAQQGGGIVSASNTRVERVDDQERTIADLTIQVRGEGAEAALSALRALGKVTSETSTSQDVTEEYVDLESNLRNLQASEAAVIRLMDRAQRIEDVVALQRELTNIRGQIERIQGRKRYLERRTDMATITLSMRLPAVGKRPTPRRELEPVRPGGAGLASVACGAARHRRRDDPGGVVLLVARAARRAGLVRLAATPPYADRARPGTYPDGRLTEPTAESKHAARARPAPASTEA